MSGLRVLVLGVGDAFSAQHYSTCLALQAEDRWLLVDCPHPIRKMMHEASLKAGLSLDLDQVEAVALTHLHADHVSGLEGLGFFSHFVLGRRARIAAHPDVAHRLWDGHLAAGMERLIDGARDTTQKGLEDFFELTSLSESEPTRVGAFAVECRSTHHHLPTTAFRVRAGGRCIGYSADTEFDPALLSWLAESDLVVHEAGIGIHASPDRLAQLPPDLRRKMRIAHYPDNLDLAGIGIEPLVEGTCLDV